jgi:hypothetical protein
MAPIEEGMTAGTGKLTKSKNQDTLGHLFSIADTTSQKCPARPIPGQAGNG